MYIYTHIYIYLIPSPKLTCCSRASALVCRGDSGASENIFNIKRRKLKFVAVYKPSVCAAAIKQEALLNPSERAASLCLSFINIFLFLFSLFSSCR